MADLRAQLQDHLGDAFRIERELGGGGMSRVFVATEVRLSRQVVIKVLSPELVQGINAERFEREILLAASLQQANIVPVLAAGEVEGLPYFTMPFVDGESLRNRIGRGMSIAQVTAIVRDVAKALAYAHQRGIVHRDIKPDNVLLSGGTAVVTDFGIAKALSASRTDGGQNATLTSVGTSIGTPAYMAPEQVAGDPNIDHRVDLYALGCMAFELLTGKSPFGDHPPQRMLAAHLSEAPKSVETLRPDCPPALALLVARLLEKDPADRLASAEEVVQLLDQAATTSSPTTALTPKGRFVRALVIYLLALGAVLDPRQGGGGGDRAAELDGDRSGGGDAAGVAGAAGDRLGQVDGTQGRDRDPDAYAWWLQRAATAGGDDGDDRDQGQSSSLVPAHDAGRDDRDGCLRGADRGVHGHPRDGDRPGGESLRHRLAQRPGQDRPGRLHHPGLDLRPDPGRGGALGDEPVERRQARAGDRRGVDAGRDAAPGRDQP